ncbi:MAG: hypothetical protein KF705_07665 [Phycisphaeraceae bacterium]|nr:hypothetical protein [Phycisphaeraceae bacterium]
MLDLIGKTSVGQLMAVVERTAVVVANDSAAIHMAVGFEAVDRLYGPTSIARVGPYRREGDVIQHVQPGEVLDHKDDLAGREMMERISVDEVVERPDRAQDCLSITNRELSRLAHPFFFAKSYEVRRGPSHPCLRHGVVHAGPHAPAGRWPFMPSSPAGGRLLADLSSSSGSGPWAVRFMRLRACGWAHPSRSRRRVSVAS